MLEQGRAIGVVEECLGFVAVRGIGQIPPGVVMAGVGRATPGLPGVVDAPAFGAKILMHLFGPIGMRDRDLGKAHERAVVVAQVVHVVLVTPVHPRHTVAALLGH